jgi:hypothetical protein
VTPFEDILEHRFVPIWTLVCKYWVRKGEEKRGMEGKREWGWEGGYENGREEGYEGEEVRGMKEG